MFDVASAAVEAALGAGARYADARAMHQRTESMAARNGDVEDLVQRESVGVGVRALVGSSWGFVAVPDPTDPEARRAGEQAAAVARASALVPGPDVALVPVEVRHDSFKNPAFVALARRYSVAIVYADHGTYPAIADVTAEFVYARLMGCVEDQPTGYAPEALAAWARRFEVWAEGGEPTDLPQLTSSGASANGRDCFVYFISGAKVRAPAAAKAFMAQLRAPPVRP